MTKNSFLLVFLDVYLLIVMNGIVQAQPSVKWEKVYGGIQNDYGTGIDQVPDGGFIISGRTQSRGAGLHDAWLVRTDENGDTLWTKTFGYFGDDYATAIQVTRDSGFIMIGNTRSIGAGGSDWWALKTDSNGVLQWEKTYGGVEDDECMAMQQTSDGGYIFSGYSRSFSHGLGDMWLVKTDANGVVEWSNNFGGSGFDGSHWVAQTFDSGYISAGFTLSYGAGSADFWLVKTNAVGDSVWSKTYGGADEDRSFFVAQTADSGFILTGRYGWTGAGDGQIWILKTDQAGDTSWTKFFGGINDESAGYIHETTDGDFIVLGSTTSFGAGLGDVWLLKLDASGNELWNETYGYVGYDIASRLYPLADGGHVLTGWTNSLGEGLSDLWLLRLNPEATDIFDSRIEEIPAVFQLKQNFPNPFNPLTKIEFILPQAGDVELSVFNVAGQKIQTLIKGKRSAGLHRVHFKVQNLASGVYLYRLETNDYQSTKKMLLLK